MFQDPYKSLEKILDIWLNSLEQYSEEQFYKHPSPTEWSLAQVYSHLIISQKEYFGKQVESCINDKANLTGKSMLLGGKLIFLFGQLPNRRYKVPKILTDSPPVVVSPSAARLELRQLKDYWKHLATQLPDAPRNQKRLHPTRGIGFLNAIQWYKFNAIHMKHHLRQKKRLEEFLGLI